MRKSRFTEEQIALALRQAEGGTPVAEICRKLQVTETTSYRWKKKYGGLGVAELRELRQLREENRKLKQVVADLTLDKHILNEALKKDGERASEAGRGGVGAIGLSGVAAAGVPGARGVALDGSVPERAGPRRGPEGATAGTRADADGLRVSSAAHAPEARGLAGEREAGVPDLP